MLEEARLRTQTLQQKMQEQNIPMAIFTDESFIAGPGGVELARASAAPTLNEATL